MAHPLEVNAISLTDLRPDMLNGVDAMHGGCSAYLVDLYVPFDLAAFCTSQARTCQKKKMFKHRYQCPSYGQVREC